MNVLSIERQSFARLPYLNARRGGGTVRSVLPLLGGRVDGLPAGLDALVLASDLQGVVPRGDHTRLLGEVLPEFVLEFVDPARTGVLLAGDLYSAPCGDERGASGDVRAVWEAFAACEFLFVAGVAGNHDRFRDHAGKSPFGMEFEAFAAEAGVDLLDARCVERAGLRVGGVSWIAGNPRKGGRRGEGDQEAALELVLDEGPDVLVLHEGPRGGRRQPGSAFVTERLERTPGRRLVVCGHSHWEQPRHDLGATTVLNVDARAIVLRRA